MSFDEWQIIEKEMNDIIEKDNTLTHIEICFNIQPIIKEKKIARINIKTFKNENRTYK